VEVKTVGVGERDLCEWNTGSGNTVQRRTHARNTRFTAVLQAVAVQIFPHKVADGSGQPVPCIIVEVVFTGGKDFVDGHAGGWVGIAVERVVAALIFRRGDVEGRFGKSQFISTWDEVLEQIKTGGTGGLGQIDRNAQLIRTRQLHRNAWDTRFASILNTVAVEVIPHEVADGSRGTVQRCVVSVWFCVETNEGESRRHVNVLHPVGSEARDGDGLGTRRAGCDGHCSRAALIGHHRDAGGRGIGPGHDHVHAVLVVGRVAERWGRADH